MKADDPNTRTDSSSDLPEALHHTRPVSGLYTASGSVLERATAHDDADLEATGPELVPGTQGGRTTARRRRTLSADDRQRHDSDLAGRSGCTGLRPSTRRDPTAYTGGIWYKDPAVTPFAYTTVDIKIVERAPRAQGEGRLQRARAQATHPNLQVRVAVLPQDRSRVRQREPDRPGACRSTLARTRTIRPHCPART